MENYQKKIDKNFIFFNQREHKLENENIVSESYENQHEYDESIY